MEPRLPSPLLPRPLTAGQVSDYPFAFWDVMPTLAGEVTHRCWHDHRFHIQPQHLYLCPCCAADLLGLPPSSMPSDIDGVSVLDAWLGGSGEHCRQCTARPHG